MSEMMPLSSLVKRIKVGYVGAVDKYYCDAVDGVKLFRPTDITPLGFDDSNVRYVTKEFYEKNKKSQVHYGDVVISRCGKDGIPVVYTSNEPAQILNAVIIEPDLNKMSSNAVQVYLRAPQTQTQIKNLTSGSVQGVINTEMVAALQVPVEAKYEDIADIVCGIDSKISNNNAICSDLESIAKLLYDYWFVQFDFPNEQGKPYKSSGGKMVWNEELKREIPAGWEVKPLGMMCQCLLGGTPSREKAEYWNGNINWINSGAVNEFRISVPSETITEEGLANTSTYLMPRNTTVLAITGATLGQVSILNIDSCANQSVIGVLENNRVPTEYIYQSVVSSMKLLMRNQTGGAQQHINKDDVQSMNLLIPSEHVMNDYMANVKCMYDAIMEKCVENQQLASLRDFLLPMLMNGQVKVG